MGQRFDYNDGDTVIQIGNLGDGTAPQGKHRATEDTDPDTATGDVTNVITGSTIGGRVVQANVIKGGLRF